MGKIGAATKKNVRAMLLVPTGLIVILALSLVYGSGDAAAVELTVRPECVSCHSFNVLNALFQDFDCSLAPCHAVTTSTQESAAHPTHFSTVKGPGVNCPDCHGSEADQGTQAGHMNGKVNFTDGGNQTLSLTSVCANCHSPGGPFNGVNSIGQSVGAKDNWKTGGVYQDASTLKAGKEKWCVGCHDDSPPTINGAAAPAVGGDNIDYGFFTAGHGMDSGSKYDRYTLGDAGGNSGAGKNCTDCHDTSLTHISGVNDTDTVGQRLRTTVNTTATGGTAMGVCKACHATSEGAPSDVQVSTHGNDESSGYSKIEDSFVIACPQCHEVHGNNLNANGVRNIKMIRRDVRISADTTADVVLTNSTATDSFDESDTVGFDDNDDLCATCHRNPNNPGYEMTRHIGGDHSGGMGSDERGNSCTSCHTHDWAEDGDVEADDGFMPSCGGCHTYPPGGTQGTYQGSKTHNMHLSTYDFACATCHYNWPIDHNESGVGSGGGWAANFNPDNVDVVFDPALNPDGTATINYAGLNRNRQCTDLYCHGQSGTINGQPISSLGGLNLSTNTPTWDYAFNPDAFARYDATKDTGACGTCHDTTKDNQAQGGTGWATWDSSAPYENDWSGTTPTVWDVTQNTSLGNATSQTAHATHLDRLRGPKAVCDTCHYAPPTVIGGSALSPPKHVNQLLDFQDGATSKSATTACATCHSAGGSYDAIDDATIGAKPNWRQGVYTADLLKSGQKKWCAGCHDEGASPSTISGVVAPPVVGDESSTTFYGATGYGFFKTGHGLPLDQVYPWTEEPMPRQGAGLGCGACHDFSREHIDSEPRTYESSVTDPADSGEHMLGYRLKTVDGSVPLEIPRRSVAFDYGDQVKTSDFRLCFSCHIQTGFTSAASTATSFRNEAASPTVNAHYLHLSFRNAVPPPGPGSLFQSDWGPIVPANTGESQATCIQCHNVHGSTKLSMIRDGKLIDREPGFLLAYELAPVGFNPPALVTLPESSGTVWDPVSVKGDPDTEICTQACHSGPGGYTSWYPRTPHYDPSPEIAQAYGQVGSGVLTVAFSEPVWSLIGGNLGANDFILTDLDDTRTIIAVTHTAGDSLAKFFLSSTLDGSNDIDVDTVAAKPGIVYDENAQSMQPDSVIITDDDNTGPTAADFDPANGATGVYANENLSFSLADASSSVDWSTFSIQLTGNLGYSQLYTDSDTDAVSKTGTRWNYNVTVDPTADFGANETITVTVNVADEVGNSMTPPAWSFQSEGGAAETMILHPSGLNFLDAVNWVFQGGGGGGWAAVLDSDDGNSSVVAGYSVGYAYFDIDDPVGLGGATIESVTIYVRAQYRTRRGFSAGLIDIGYETSTTHPLIEETGLTVPAAGDLDDFKLVNTATYSTDSDGGSLDLDDINNLLIYTETTEGALDLFMTEAYAEVVYIP